MKKYIQAIALSPIIRAENLTVGVSFMSVLFAFGTVFRDIIVVWGRAIAWIYFFIITIYL